MIFSKTREIFWKFVLHVPIELRKKDAFKQFSKVW